MKNKSSCKTGKKGSKTSMPKAKPMGKAKPMNVGYGKKGK
jgi:hypothetical protein